MREITREEFLTFSVIPEIINAKEVGWFKSNEEGDILGIIIEINTNHKYDYLVYEKDKNEEYILYPNEWDFSSSNYEAIYNQLAAEMRAKSIL